LTLELKVPPVLLTGLTAVSMWLVSKVTTPVFPAEATRVIAAALLVASSGVIGLAGVTAFHKAKTTVNPLTPGACSILVESGVYRFTRNPMYLALVTALIGWALYLGSPWTLIPIAAFVLYIDHFQIRPEERALESAFGPAFQNYKSKVRKWL